MSVLSDALLTEVMYLHGHPDYIVPESTLAFLEEASSTIEAQSKLIEELRGLLQRADKHVVWESIGFSRDFQDEIESALSKANPHSEKVE